jgi:predicted peptidase
MPYRIFIPRDYNSHKKYPLVLWLHGGAGRGTDNLRQISGGNTSGSHLWISVDVQKKYPAFVIAPQCPENEMWATVERAKPTRQLRIVEELLSSIQKQFNINSQQFYVSGQSMGGFGTWALISEHPETFAAAIPVCGGGDESMAPRLIHTAIWAFHGERDQAVSVERSREMIAAIKKAGGTPMYTEYEGVGHNSWDRAFIEPNLLSWVFAQRARLRHHD